MNLPRILSKLFRRHGDLPGDVEVQDLRAAFASRYHNFKLLLTANNKALEIMSELEMALEGGRPFGMSFVKSRCTAVSVNVFRIIKHLDELAPKKYTELYNRFKTIEARVQSDLTARQVHLRTDELVLPLQKIDKNMSDQVGNKMANIGELRNEVGIPVPGGFVITAAAYEAFMRFNDLQIEIDRRSQAATTERIDELLTLSSDIQQVIMRAPVPERLEKEIIDAYQLLEAEMQPGIKVSMRSSALGEDAAGTSFAGQFRSELNVSQENLIHAYKTIVASKYGLPAITYRLARGIPDEEVLMCVGCMAMVDAYAGGVMYSRNPLNFRDKGIVINSVWGLPKAVVDGTVDSDLFTVSRTSPKTIVHKAISKKEIEFRCFPDEGVCRNELIGPKATEQSISDEQAVDLAEIAVRLEEYYGHPQDIEWAVDPDGSILILQCRPLQQLNETELTGNPKSGVNTEGIESKLAGGVTASPGVACGHAYIVRNDADKLQFPEGAVLVTAQSLPRWAPLLSSAVAVITELGGVAGHLANVAREFGVPAIFGLTRATEILNNGDLVTVDAESRRVYPGRIDALLSEASVRKNLMAGSPVFEILKKVTRHITPLHLLDPDSPDFRPKKCETLHDITRYCHEKSVHEMFSFGKEHHFSERSSKQLVCHVPMQWWIINLDDGFREDVKGKYVALENIVSIPMLAIWEGVIAVPWEGPPPVDAGGFMSVLMQATSNPALDPTMRSPYAARNYFMLSKHFCSLTSRFGFHFSTVEALVGDRASENYISFSFKGGAADLQRKVKRAIFVGQILEQWGFRTEIKEDNAFARLEGFDADYMKSRLKIIGYLIIHTRQLDMVMSNDNSVMKYRKRIVDDITNHVLTDMSTVEDQPNEPASPS
ncbi:MAG: pyruvate, water dikinase [Thermodesulfobacteriota bacterium]|nr:pyruvate, water dikinase [Thermodesulfobacteriota bacterium]